MNLLTILSQHPSVALEYWFFKVNSGPIALLADWIARARGTAGLERRAPG